MKFDASYRETIVLNCGTQVLIRYLKPTDDLKILKGFESLSSRSRYFRFFSAKNRLSAKELRFLTELDGFDHFGLVAICLGMDDKEEDGAGVARFIRCAEDSTIAEPAVTVVDRLQGRGLGRLLCQRIALAAIERRIMTFRCYLLPENERIRRLLNGIFPNSRFTMKSGLAVATVDLRQVLQR